MQIIFLLNYLKNQSEYIVENIFQIYQNENVSHISFELSEISEYFVENLFQMYHNANF